MSDRTQRKIARLEKQIEETEELIEEWQEKEKLAENPNERKRSQIEIDRLKKILDAYEAELESLEGKSPQKTSGLPTLFLAFANKPSPESSLSELEFIQKEENAIEKLLRPFDAQGDLRLVLKSQTSLSYLYNMADSYKDSLHFLHYGGHADEGNLYVQEGGAEIMGLARLLGEAPHFHFLFLNGCSSEGLVTDFLRQGVKVVLGTKVPIGDETAYLFAQSFYERLVKGENIQQAFNWTVSLLEDRKLLNRGEVKSRHVDLQPDSPLAQKIKNPWGLYYRDPKYLEWTLPLNDGA
ncbi:MAG: CHAT domain-containing protein [Bacteroidota bacterium]